MDQAISYARDLANYHSQCSNIRLRCCLVLTKAKRFFKKEEDLEIVSPSELKKLCETLVKDSDRNKAINLDDFLSISAYKPLPSLIKAARELFQSGDLTRIHRSASETKPAVETCFQIIQETFLAKRRALILVNGAPGAGKTLWFKASL